MASNIEIKAKIGNLGETIRLAAEICGTAGEQIVQRDTFFNCTTGRLKLREFGDGSGQLISYLRQNALEPTQSEYAIYRTQTPEVLRETLSMTSGLRGEVKKIRHLFMSDRTRIHIDIVEGLGEFLELEVVLAPGEDESKGIQETHTLMDRLGVSESDLISGAYIDLIETHGKTRFSLGKYGV